MAQSAQGKADVRTFLAGDTMTAYAVVTFMTTGTGGPFARPWQTDTQAILGVSLSPASLTGEAVDIVLAGPTAKCLVNTSISAGAIVGPATGAAGRLVEIGMISTTTANRPVLGISLTSVSDTSSIIEVLLNVETARRLSA